MTLTLLPEEVLEEIVKCLSVKDVLACSAINIEWREKFNVDIFWKKFCIRGIKDYLEDTCCKVQPSFSPPENYGERLQPLCDWRVHFMRNVHLLNNWKSQKSESYGFRTYDGITSSTVRIDCDKFHWLFLRTQSEIEIWNINTNPEFMATITVFPDCSNVNIFIVGKRVVITQWNIVSVYALESNKENCQCSNRFLLEENESLPIVSWNSTDKGEINNINKEDDFRFAHFGILLVGYKRIENVFTELLMHIWDTTSGSKVKIECMSNCLSHDNIIDFTNIYGIDDKRGLIRIVFHSPEDEIMCSQLYVYDFNKLVFTETNVMFVGVAVWCGCVQDIIVTFSSNPGGIFKFHDYSSGKLLYVKEIGEYTNSDQVQIVDSFLLYCTFNCMNVLDILKQEIVYCLHFGVYSFVRRLTVIEPRFVVVWLLERGTGPGCPSYYQEVWDVKDLSSKMFQCSSEHGQQMVTHSPSIVKQVINLNGILHLFTFW